MENTDRRITPEMCRAGRALLRISQAQLARRAGVSRLTVAHFERAASKPIPVSLAAIRNALESSGIALLPGGAVLREPDTASAPVGSQKASEILKVLRTAAPRLRELGVKHVSIFGSTARGTQRPDSDIDLLLDLDEQRKIDLLDYAGIVAEIQKMFPQHVDVALRKTLKSHVARNLGRDEIRAF
jgi:predicted nucleotidyltransferase/DNA-binding XRE family transcriptional regulator